MVNKMGYTGIYFTGMHKDWDSTVDHRRPGLGNLLLQVMPRRKLGAASAPRSCHGAGDFWNVHTHPYVQR